MPTQPQDPLSGTTIDYPITDSNPALYIDFTDDEPSADTIEILDFSNPSFVEDVGDESVTYPEVLTSSVGQDAPTPDYGGGVTSILSPNQLSDSWYNRYEIASRYMTDMGLRQQSVCGPAGTPPEELRVHGGCTKKIVAWIAERIGTWPVLPGPQTGVPGESLRYKQFEPEVPCPQADEATLAYRVRGIYVYDCAYVLQDTDPLNAGTNDVITVPATSNTVQYGQFDSTLLQGLSPAGPFGSIAT